MRAITRYLAIFALLLLAVANPVAAAPGAAGADWAAPGLGDGTALPVAAGPPLTADDDDGKYTFAAPAGWRAPDVARAPWQPCPLDVPDPAYLIPLQTGPPAA